MTNSLSYELHNECYKLISRKSKKDLINDVMNKLYNTKENITNKNIDIDMNIQDCDYNKDSLSETIIIKIIKLIMCIR